MSESRLPGKGNLTGPNVRGKHNPRQMEEEGTLAPIRRAAAGECRSNPQA